MLIHIFNIPRLIVHHNLHIGNKMVKTTANFFLMVPLVLFLTSCANIYQQGFLLDKNDVGIKDGTKFRLNGYYYALKDGPNYEIEGSYNPNGVVTP